MTSNDDTAGRSVYRIVFDAGTDMAAVNNALTLSILTVGCLHGEAALRLEVGFAISQQKRSVVLDAGGPLAIAVAKVFVGMCAHELGDRTFRVLRCAHASPKEVSTTC